ncbi:MAG: hypothetical protein HY400_06015 [Elusimicrobia bacterium]|nr:hypothetical protein [Elusimicrobiota bacterium]
MPEEEKRPAETRALHPKPRYMQVLFFLFILPVLFFWKAILKRVQKKPFFISIGIISVIGWIWSAFLSAMGWWAFQPPFLMGIWITPWLPLEEFLFYPFGGILCIFLYNFCSSRFQKNKSPADTWTLLGAGNLLFLVLSLYSRSETPSYLYSQFIVYNLLTLALAPFIVRTIHLPALSVPIVLMGVVGFFWDHAAFKYNWWVYNTDTKIRFFFVPLDDFNFFIFAPSAAISIYINLCRLYKLPPAPSHP